MIPADHYCIDPLDRVDMDGILTLIRQKRYFVMHAPRQTGKTSTLLALRDRLNSTGEFRCLYANVEAAQAVREDIGAAIRIVLSELVSRARSFLRDKSVHALRSEILESEPPGAALNEFLVRWSAARPKPLVLLIDEIDCLMGDALISVLRPDSVGIRSASGAVPAERGLVWSPRRAGLPHFLEHGHLLHRRGKRVQYQRKVAAPRRLHRDRGQGFACPARGGDGAEVRRRCAGRESGS